MNNFRDLKFIGSPEEQDKLIQLIDKNLQDGWIRDNDKESELNGQAQLEYRIFSRSKVDSLPTADLFLISDANSYLYVSNIISSDKSQSELDVKAYNIILEEFFTKFVKPCIENLDVRAIFTEASRNINNSMSPDLAVKLNNFLVVVNKTAATMHPLDQERFMDFIIQAHLENSLLDESTLKSLLTDKNWSEENSSDLSTKYEFGREILKKFTTL